MGLREYTRVSHFSSFSSEIQDCCIKVIGGGFNGIYDRDLVCKDDLTLFRTKGIPVRETGLMQEHFVVDKLVG